jgi:hypothetical protein
METIRLKLALKTYVSLSRKILFSKYKQGANAKFYLFGRNKKFCKWENKVQNQPNRVILLVFAGGYF